jgi:hypothetical protein
MQKMPVLLMHLNEALIHQCKPVRLSNKKLCHTYTGMCLCAENGGNRFFPSVVGNI